MAKSVLDKAESYLGKRQFPKVISLLEPLVTQYRDSFRYHYYLGIACLYVDDVAGAELWFKCARKIKMQNVDLIMAQAVVALIHGKRDISISYCLEALDLEPQNKYALKFLELLRNSTPDEISEAFHNGKLKKYYPPLPKRFNVIPLLACICVVCCALCVTLVVIRVKKNNARLDYEEYTISDKSELLDKSMGKMYRYILTVQETENYYKKAQEAINSYDDNEAQRYINILLNSNSSNYLQNKVLSMQSILVEPTMESKFTNYTFEQITKDVYMYEKCWVLWSGRVTNIQVESDFTYCDLLVGYEDFKKKDGDAKLKFSSQIRVASEKPIRVLAQVAINEKGELLLLGKSVYQPLGDKF